MNDQAKRWTAEWFHEGRMVFTKLHYTERGKEKWRNGYYFCMNADVHAYETSEAAAMAADVHARLALLQDHPDLSAVAVMAWADVEKVRRALEHAEGVAHEDALAELDPTYRNALALLPVPPKGDA